jgi:hypothetical protein
MLPIAPTPVYLLRDEFATDAAAPMGTSPITRTCEPGPGTLLLNQDDGDVEYQIIDGVISLTASPGSGQAVPGMYTPSAFPRKAGLTLKHRTAQDPIGPGPNETGSPVVGWSGTKGNQFAKSEALLPIGRWSWIASSIVINYMLETCVPNTFYTFAHVVRSAGMFHIIDGKLAGIDYSSTNANLYGVIASAPAFNRHTPKTDYIRIAQLGGPWQSDYGIATQRLAGARSATNAFTHEANAFWLDFVLTTLPSSGNIEIEVRRTDANNCWKLQVTSAGAFNLIEVVAGTPTTRTTIASNANGDRLMLVMDGATALLNRWRTGATESSLLYTSVSTFTTQTAGVISSLGTGGAVSDLVTWPRNLSGDALAWLNAL